MKFILGTASFDSKYGIANRDNQTSEKGFQNILSRARELNIESLDTAPNYGNAESLIGRFHSNNKPFNVYSKISNLSSFSTEKVIDQIHESRDSLKIEKFSGLLFHKSEFLDTQSEKLTKNLIDEILSSGLTTRVGVSVYQESEIERIAKKFPDIKLFQVPENVMDRRLLNSKVIQSLFEQGVEFHVRSIFLQGLFLTDTKELTDSFSHALAGIRELKNYCEKQEISIIDLCINYVNQIEWASKIVVGVNSRDQLPDIVNFQEQLIDSNSLPKSLPENILDPRQWASK